MSTPSKLARPPASARYAAAVLGVAAATALRAALDPYVGQRMPFVVYYFVMIPAAWHLGAGPSLLALALAVYSGSSFFLTPIRGLGVAEVTDLIGIALFIAVNLVLVTFAEVSRGARHRLEVEVAERARAEATVREQVHRVEFARDIGLALTSSPTLATVLERCAALTVRYLGGDRARITTLAESGLPLRPEVPAGPPVGPTGDRGFEEAAVALRGLVGRVAADRRPLLTNRLVDDSGEFDREWARREEMVALAAVPLVVEGRLVGIWTLASRAPLPEATLPAMESIASTLALGIERHRAEEGVRVGEARKTAILESSLDGIITMDHRGRVVEFNPAAERIFGLTAAAVEGRPLAETLIPPTLRPAYQQGLDRYLATGEGVILDRRVELPALRADGTEFPAEVTVARIPIPGPPMFTAHVRDIGDRKRAEEALRTAKDAAEDASRAKDRFIAVLSHELRTPLNPIALSVNALLARAGHDAEARRDLEAIRHYVALEARLIDDLLDATRVARGKLPLLPERADAHGLVEEAAAICAGAVDARSLDLHLDLRAAEHLVRADPTRLGQVFWNLIQNAVKFTPVGGSIAIRSRNEPTPGGGAGDPVDLIVEVSDTGIGIDPEVLPRIFDAFQQGESSINRRYGGLGLGLAICHGVVEGHGGSLTARSAGRDRGATFAVRLRVDREPADAPSTPAADAAPAPAASPALPFRPAATRFDDPAGPIEERRRAVEASLQVLIVEDEPATIRLMARLLRGLGHHVIAAETVAEAARWVDGSEPLDLIVSDIGLPDGTGLDLMRRVRAARGDLPGIALTGFGTDEDIEQSRLAGFTAHMTKPIDFNQLESLIRQVVGPPSG